MSHTHHKWDCPKSNGRHIWNIKWDVLPQDLRFVDNKIGLPVFCAYGCGAYGIEWYEFKEVVEGE